LCTRITQEINKEIEDIKSNNKILEENIVSLQSENNTILSKLDEIEQGMKQEQLRVYGIPENIDNISNHLKGVFDAKLGLKNINVEHCFRIGKRDDTTTTPRPLLVTFGNIFDRNQVFYTKKNFKGSRISVTEELTKKRYELLIFAKEKLGKEKVWSTRGRIYTNFSGGKRRIFNEEDIISMIED